MRLSVWSDPPRAARWAESGSFPRSRLARRPLCAPRTRRTEARLRGVSPFPRVSPQWRPRLGFRVAFLVFASSSSSDREAPDAIASISPVHTSPAHGESVTGRRDSD